MEKCPVCASPDLSKYPYNNHLKKVRKTHLKHLLGSILSPVLKILNPRLHQALRVKMLFSPFSYISRCNACGYGVYEKQIDLDLIESYYNGSYWQAKGFPVDKWHEESVFLDDARANGQYACVRNWVEPLKEVSMLEIGAASALFSRFLRKRHPGTVHCSVVEGGDGWEPYYKETGISLAAKFFPFEGSGKFDYIHTSHWLEHVVDLPGAVLKIKSLLKSGGLLFVEVPNCDASYFSLGIEDAPHIHFFTKRSLNLFFEKHGFIALSSDTYGLNNCEDFEFNASPQTFNKEILRDADRSIRDNLPRRGGFCLRAVFRLPSV